VSGPFNTALRRGAGEPRDLIARVDAEVRDRIGEAVDFVCLDAMVEARRAAGLPSPVPDSTRDRAEFDRRVEAFLGRLAEAMLPALDPEGQRSIEAARRAAGDRLAQLVSVQVALAKRLPDYWQRFEQIRAADGGADASPRSSGSDRPGWLDRLLGR
jgi:hypothetical protein